MIWRTIAVDGGITLRHLHQVLQVAYNWESRNLYQFRIGDKVYCDLDSNNDNWVASPSFARMNDRNVTLESIACQGDTLTYTYDFGDDWQHDITIGDITVVDRPIRRAILLSGDNAGPIEDSGGAYGYMQLMDTLRHARDPAAYDEAVEFVREYGLVLPAYCDVRAINAALARLAVQQEGRA